VFFPKIKQTFCSPKNLGWLRHCMEGAWTSAPLSAHLSTGWECTASQIETPICTRRTQLIDSSDDNSSAALWPDHRWNTEWLGTTTRLRSFIPGIGNHSSGMTLPRRTACVRLNYLCTGVERFRSYLHKWASAVAILGLKNWGGAAGRRKKVRGPT